MPHFQPRGDYVLVRSRPATTPKPGRRVPAAELVLAVGPDVDKGLKPDDVVLVALGPASPERIKTSEAGVYLVRQQHVVAVVT